MAKRRREVEPELTPEQKREKWSPTFERWLSDGKTWVGVFENQAFDSAGFGDRFAVSFDMADFDKAKLGDRAPDTSMGLGWKFALLGKARTVEEVFTFMDRAKTPGKEQESA